MVDVYSVLSPMMTTQKKILPAGVTFNPSSFLSQSPDFLKPGLCYVQDFLYLWTKFFKQNTARTVTSVFPSVFRQYFGSRTLFVVSFPPCRNNSEKISPNYLEYAETRRIFAISKGNNDIPETSIDSKFNNLNLYDYEAE